MVALILYIICYTNLTVQGEPPGKLDEGTEALLLELLEDPVLVPGKLDGGVYGCLAGSLVLDDSDTLLF